MKNRIQIVFGANSFTALNFATEEQTKEIFDGLLSAAKNRGIAAFEDGDIVINFANFQWMSIVEGNDG